MEEDAVMEEAMVDGDDFEDDVDDDPYGYDMFTQSLPFVIRPSPTYGGKGVLTTRSLAANEEVWEEDPIFSWAIAPDPALRTLLRMKKCAGR